MGRLWIGRQPGLALVHTGVLLQVEEHMEHTLFLVYNRLDLDI